MTLPDTSPLVTTQLLSPRYRWATVDMTSLILLAAFEVLAVTTILPAVSADLDGRAWFSVAFSAPLAASVVGMVFAGLSPTIEIFLAARFLQGLGSGAMAVALYVLVARVYEPVDHPRIFGAVAAAWVVPPMVGPTVAGVVAQASGWRWVFLWVVVPVLAAAATMLPAGTLVVRRGLRDGAIRDEVLNVAVEQMRLLRRQGADFSWCSWSAARSSPTWTAASGPSTAAGWTSQLTRAYYGLGADGACPG